MSHAKRSPTLGLSLASLLFVLSGATGLAYEVVWFKRFTQVWGASSASTAAVVACFLFGLGLGAHLFGRIADRARKPIRLYALCELGIAALAIAIHFAIPHLFPVSSWIYSTFEDRVSASFARFGVTFLVLGPPTVLMGATLPLFVRQFAIAGSSVGAATAWLYFANSLGAALGAWVAGFYLLPVLGLAGTNALVAGVNILVAVLAWMLTSEFPDAAPLRDDAAPLRDDAPHSARAPALPRPLVLAAFLSGTGSIVLQMVWTRNLAVLVGGTTYAFSAIVAVFVFGLACGSLVHRLVVRQDSDVPRVIGIACLGVATSTIVGWLLQFPLTGLVGQVGSLRSDPAFNALVCVGASAALVFLPTFFMGLFFPALVQHSGAGGEHAGRTVGRLYAWNTVGAILGATTTAVVLMPRLGSFGTTLFVLTTYGAIVFVLFPPRARELHPAPLALGASTLLVVLVSWLFFAPDEEDHKRLNIGSYLYGAGAYETVAAPSEVLLFREAPTANVLALLFVEDDGFETLTLRVNGKVDGGNLTDMGTQLGTAYLPRFLRPDASDVLVIGFGTGTTAGASLLFPGTRVDCCEIERAVVEASRFFHGFNHAPDLAPNFRAIYEDGRSFVQGTEESYDLVISEPSNPWIAGIANLYTLEFYRAVRARLKPGGMLCQWIQAYNLRPAEFALVARTLRESFDHIALLRLNDDDLMFLASDSPIVPDATGIDRAQALVDGVPVVRDELVWRFGSSDVRTLLLAHFALDAEGLERVSVGVSQVDSAWTADEVNTDSNLRLEFDAPRRLFGAVPAGEETVLQALLRATDASQYYALIERFGWREAELEGLQALRRYYFRHGQAQLAAEISILGQIHAPDTPEFVADELLLLPPNDLEEFRAGARHLLRLSTRELQRVAAGLGQSGDYPRAAVAFETLVQELPTSATAFAGLAVVYGELGRREEAERMAARAEELDPINETTVIMRRVREQKASGEVLGATDVPP